MKDFIESTKLVKAANFTPDMGFLAGSAIHSLYYLKDLAERIGVRMEDIMPEDIIKDFGPADRAVRQMNDALQKYSADKRS